MGLWPFNRRQRSFEAGAGSKRPDRDDLAQRRTSISRKLSRRSQQPQGIRRNRRRRDRDSPFPTPTLPPRISSSILDSLNGSYTIDIYYDIDHNSTRQNDASSPSHTSLADSGLNHRSVDPSSVSTHQPQKKRNVLRRLRRRPKDESKNVPSSSPYRGSRFSRRDAKKSKYERYLGEYDRSLTPGSTVESDISRRAYKIRSRDVFSPCPTLQYDHTSSVVSGKSRDTSRAYSRSQSRTQKGSLVPESRISDRNLRVDDLVDELDEAGLREAMERDHRKREQKRLQHEERLRLRQDRKAIRLQGQIYHQLCNPGPSTVPTAVLQDPRTGHAISGTQTPVSCLNEDPSVEDINPSQMFIPRMDVITPVSMDLPEDHVHTLEQSMVIEDMTNDTAEVAQPAEETQSTDSIPPPQAAQADRKSQSMVNVRSTGRMEKARSRWRSLFSTGSKIQKKKKKARRSITPTQSTISSYLEDEFFGNNQHGVNTTLEPQLNPEDLAYQEQASGLYGAPIARHFEEPYSNEDNFDDTFRDFDYTPGVDPHNNVSPLSSRSDSLNNQEELRDGDTIKPDRTSDSPTIPPQHLSGLYSPTHKQQPGGISPENPPDSVISSSLASVDSEGCWLAGKLSPPQHTIQQVTPLRASASVLRKRYNELADANDGSVGDRYFTGVATTKANEDNDLTMFDSADDDDTASITSEVERNMWRDGVQKRVELSNPLHMRARSTVGILDEFGDEEMDDAPGLAR